MGVQDKLIELFDRMRIREETLPSKRSVSRVNRCMEVQCSKVFRMLMNGHGKSVKSVLRILLIFFDTLSKMKCFSISALFFVPCLL